LKNSLLKILITLAVSLPAYPIQVFADTSTSGREEELRQVMYVYGGAGWEAAPAHVICSTCPPLSRLKGMRKSLKNSLVKMKVRDSSMRENGVSEGKPIHTVYFAFDSAGISAPESEEIRKIVENLKDTDRIEVKGYTCDIGSKDYNDKLALKRAMSVAERLTSLGIGKDRLKIEGRGKCCYEDGPRSLNRRVEIGIIANVKGDDDE